MVDSVDNSYNSLQRIQQIALQNLQANRKISQALVNATQTTAVAKVNLSGVSQASKNVNVAFAATSKTPLPRGSIVDKLV
jgi:hypothetical protein